MELHKDWKKIALHAWSSWGMIVAGILSGFEIFFQVLQPAYTTPWFAIASGLVTCLAWIARITAQKNFEEDNGDEEHA